MLYELIYTRCRQGIDITRKGQQVSGDGYKVYSCTPAIMKDGYVDLQLLTNVVQAKQSYNDPGFMDDAYLFYTPDTGASFLVNFHPVPFDANAGGDYSHRPGNFVNHAIVGDFSQFYPYELFRDDGVWSAKTKNEAFYYENPSAALPERTDINDLKNIHYGLDEISDFIANGREDALKNAVAFIISQYNEEPENRKYLVIKDDSSKNIELWIAAIESAFSPEMASAIPFATRMDKFINTNRYTVKLGLYQPQMNLQDSNQKQRYRAMIVGVDERDTVNANTANPLANSPFVLLDGNQKKVTYKGDISNSYYQTITKFDDEHIWFCRDFLQLFKGLKPNTKVLDLYEISNVFSKPDLPLPNAKKLSEVLEKLSDYQADNTTTFKYVYERIKKDSEISRFLQEDLSCALKIINWIQRSSKITDDTGEGQRLINLVCDEAKNIIFLKSGNADEKRSFWDKIQRTDFVMNVARALTDSKTIEDSLPSTEAFTSTDAIEYVKVYLSAASIAGNIEQQDMKKVVKSGAVICYRKSDTNTLNEIVSLLSLNKNINRHEFMLSLAKRGDTGLGEFIANCIIKNDATITASDSSMLTFCELLEDSDLRLLVDSVVGIRYKKLTNFSDMESFLRVIHDMDCVGKELKETIFRSLDNKISITADNTMMLLVKTLQNCRPQGVNCINSARLISFGILDNNEKKHNLIDAFEELSNQDFLIATDDSFRNRLIEKLLKVVLNNEEQQYILGFLYDAPEGYFEAYVNKLLTFAAKNQDKWNALLVFSSSLGDEQAKKIVFNCIVNALVESKQDEKKLTTLESLLKNNKSREYFSNAADEAWKKILYKKKNSLIGRLGKLVGTVLDSAGNKTNKDEKKLE
jgi:hypothetical protein